MRSAIPLFAMIACCGLASGQTNELSNASDEAGAVPGLAITSAPAATDATNATPETHISSDHAKIKFNSRTVIYWGNVRLEDPRITITCGQLTAVVPEEGERLDSATAETNVVIVVVDQKGVTNRIFSDQAVYTFVPGPSGTNETVVFSGNPKVERPDGTVEADLITYDLISQVVDLKHQRMVTPHQPSVSTGAPMTHADSPSTNAVPEPTSEDPASNE